MPLFFLPAGHDAADASRTQRGGRAAAAAGAPPSQPQAALETPDTLPEGVELNAQGQYSLQVPVKPRFFGAVIGRNGATLRSVQQRTGAVLTVPGKKSKDEFVTVQAATLDKLDAARLEVDLLVADAVERSPPTHFLSLPLATSPEVAAAVQAFLDDICSGTPVSGGGHAKWRGHRERGKEEGQGRLGWRVVEGCGGRLTTVRTGRRAARSVDASHSDVTPADPVFCTPSPVCRR